MIILHIGAPKSGTTSLQSFLHATRDELGALGLTIPSCGWTSNGGHGGFREALKPCNDGDPQAEATRRAYTATFESGAPVLVSCEQLWTASPERAIRVYPALARAKVVFVYRDQVDTIDSHYAQKVKGGAQTETIYEYFQRNAELYDFERMYLKWAAVVGADGVAPLSYEEMSADRGLIPNFLGRIADMTGLDGEAMQRLLSRHLAISTKRANRRQPAAITAAMLMINRANLDPDTAKRLRLALLDDHTAFPDPVLEVRRMISPELEAEIRARYADSNAALQALIRRESA